MGKIPDTFTIKMDIDEFLDKEIQAEKKEGVKEHGFEQSTQEIKEPKETSEMRDFEGDDLTKLEKKYSELWKKISEKKFSWSSELYDNIDKLGNEINHKVKEAGSRLHEEKNYIENLMGKAERALNNNDHETALKAYSEIIELRDKMPDAFFQEKKEINDELFGLYEKLHKQLDSKFFHDFKNTLLRISGLIKSSFSGIENKNLEEAKKFYEEAIVVYNELPHGFLHEKTELGNDLLALYKEISIHEQIQNLQNQLNHNNINEEHLEHIREFTEQNIKSGKKESAITDLRGITQKDKRHENKNLLVKLIERKLDRASSDMERGLYVDAKKSIEAVLKLDPRNKHAKRLLNKMPA